MILSGGSDIGVIDRDMVVESSGAVESGNTLASGGQLLVASGGTAISVTLGSGGTQTVLLGRHMRCWG